MDINNVINNVSPYTNNTAASAVTASPPQSENVKDAVDNTSNTKTDYYEKSDKTYTPDLEKVNAMKQADKNNASAFAMMVQKMFGGQAEMDERLKNIIENLYGSESSEITSDITDENGEYDFEKAQEYYSVENTANRILEFAKALSGGDPSKVSLLKDAFLKGYDAAEKAFGGELPEISQKTKEKILEGFERWEKEGNADFIE